MTADPTGYTQALYPSTLVVVYEDGDEAVRYIMINEGCDELAVTGFPNYNYNVTAEEATTYETFNSIPDISSVENAVLYSFAGSAGSAEGNLLYDGTSIATNAWTGDYYTAYPLVEDVKSVLNSNNEFGIQATDYGGMVALQQILVVEYE